MAQDSFKWNCLIGLCIVVYICVSIFLSKLSLTSLERKDQLHPHELIHRHEIQQMMGAHDWAPFSGTCGTSTGLQVTYTETDITDNLECYKLCDSIPTCSAFTVARGPDDVQCRLGSSCAFRLHGPDHMTYIRPSHKHKSHMQSSVMPSSHPCSQCPDYGPCYGQVVCRLRKCFRGPRLPDNTRCDDKNNRTIHDVCVAGTCHGTHHRGGKSFADQIDVLAAFDIKEGVGCIYHSQEYNNILSTRQCAELCWQDTRCAAFTMNPDEKQCLLYPKKRCHMKRHSWTSGMKRAQGKPPQELS
eukprot:m.343580 g.343580  ORF g.343580 m.343580 type:complete len:300 (-) comp23038_c0_seq1:34-933(-)